MAFLQFVPALLLIILANVAARRPRAEPVVFAILILVNVLAMFAGVLALLTVYALPRIGVNVALADLDWRLIGIVMFAMGFLATIVLIPSVRRFLAHLMPLNRESVVDATALAMGVYYVGLTAITILLVGGTKGLAQTTVPQGPRDYALSGVAIFLAGVLGVGFLIRRKPGATASRLGLTGLKLPQVGAAVAIVIGFLVLDYLVAFFWKQYLPQSYAQQSALSNALYGARPALLLCVSIAVSAGISEETLFRGAIQPRFGIVATAALWALGHLQYGFTPALAEIFVVGIILGVVRRWANTSTTMIIHTVYNFADLMLAPLFP